MLFGIDVKAELFIKKIKTIVKWSKCGNEGWSQKQTGSKREIKLEGFRSR